MYGAKHGEEIPFGVSFFVWIWGGGCFEKQIFCVKITKREFYERYKNTRYFVRAT